MIKIAEKISRPGFEVVRVVLTPDVSQHETGAIASALFGLPQCTPFRNLLLSEACRGVSAANLPRVLETGIDVRPSNASIWVSSIDKAAEYGEWPKLILVLDPRELDRTFRELPDSATEEERAAVRLHFPTETRSPEGNGLWFSRLPAKDPRLASGYEIAYGRWIPGDAKKALRAVIIIEHALYGTALQIGDLESLCNRPSSIE